MNSREIKRTFLQYFKTHGHEIVESSSLIPQDDPSLLFTNAGMVQFKSIFLGRGKRPYTRAVSSQKCMRAGGKHNDLENVGYTLRHHTFFEMLGNFSFGDYFKEEAIIWAWELLTEIYKLPKDKLYASVYEDDDEAYRIWEDKIGLHRDRIIRLGEKDNFWAMGDTGPCGPCSEILIDQGPAVGCGRQDCAPGCDCDRYLEIWNLVFTQFNRDLDGKLIPLPNPNIDTGMGLERLTAVVQGVTSNYDTDIFKGLIALIEELSGKKYGNNEREDVAFRVISDHARALTFLIGDGIIPSNEGRGYVLRRIIRRAIRFGQLLKIDGPFLNSVISKVVEIMGEDYSELIRSEHFIKGVVNNEEKRFADTLHYGMTLLEEELKKLRTTGGDTIPGDVAFRLYDTYGLSLDIVQDVARDEGLKVDIPGYKRAMSKQKAISQKSWKGSGEAEIPDIYRSLMDRGVTTHFIGYHNLSSTAKIVALLVDGKETSSLQTGVQAEVVLDQTPFYGKSGGQTGDTGWLMDGETKFRVTDTLKFGHGFVVHKGQMESGVLSFGDKVEAIVDKDRRKATELNHTATHLLHAVLREVLGQHVKQAGSLVSYDRIRFDFSHFTQVSRETLEEIEIMINRLIRENLPVIIEEMTKEKAMKTGAMAIFEERYGEIVRLVKIGDGVSMELCGGTHTARTGDIGLFRIVNENAVAANVRRIEAVTGEAAIKFTLKQDSELKLAALLLKVASDKVGERIKHILKDYRKIEREIESLKAKLLTKKSEDLISAVKEINGIKVLAMETTAESPSDLREAADRIKDKLGSCIILLGAKKEDKVMLVSVVTQDLTEKFKAGDIIKRAAHVVGGRGGGRADMAQGGGNRPEKLKDALYSLYEFVEDTDI